MIRSFADEETRQLWLTGKSRRFGNIARVAAREITWRNFVEIGKGNTASGSTTSSESVFNGKVIMPGRSKSRTTTEKEPILRQPGEYGVRIHPGEFLREDFMKPLGLSANALAIAFRVPVTRIAEIIRERRGITVETAMRLGRYFGTSTQKAWELATAERGLLARVRAEVQPAPRDPKTHELLQRATA